MKKICYRLYIQKLNRQGGGGLTDKLTDSDLLVQCALRITQVFPVVPRLLRLAYPKELTD